MNLVLAMIVIAEACFGICLWLTPNLLRRVAAQLLTRADVIDASRAERERRIQFWCGELGVTQDEPLTVGSPMSHPAVSSLAQN
ncbi:MAG TPA: hypothetical protein VMB25_01295 [Bryobacteraceae bacterium]|nr:hypothetical protein [Bryobacteraceae bacterium]